MGYGRQEATNSEQEATNSILLIPTGTEAWTLCKFHYLALPTDLQGCIYRLKSKIPVVLPSPNQAGGECLGVQTTKEK